MPHRFVPNFDQFRAMGRRGNLIPVYREIFADLDTPVSAFLKLDDGGDAFLLESVEGGEKWGRYSFIGVAPDLIVTSKGKTFHVERPGGRRETQEVADPLVGVREILHRYRPVEAPGLPRFAGGLVGYVAYDVVRFFERLPEKARDDLGHPDLYLMLTDTLVVFDNVKQTIQVVSHALIDEGTDLREAYETACTKVDRLIERLRGAARVPGPLPVPRAAPEVRSTLSAEQYQATVRQAKEYVFAGDVIQVVLAQQFQRPLHADPFNIYRCLRTVNPSPYMFFLRTGGLTILGASPEVMVRLEGREITVRPIAGTRPRGRDEHQDAELERELRSDPKERAEHIMLVDLGRNDVGRVARVGTVAVTEQMVVERYSHVMHLVSNVRGELADGLDCFDAFRATFPAGTLTGAPKIRAMEIIEELEPTRRGIYGGAVGYFSFSGNMDTCITIRTIVIDRGMIHVGAGAGIVADSDPEREQAECLNKARALFQAVELAEEM